MTTKDATLVINIESELKNFLQNVASSKRISLSEYAGTYLKLA